MMRIIGLFVALAAGTAAAGEMDCYNDDVDDSVRYTRAEPDALRVSDAEVAAMLARIRANESRTVASGDAQPAMQARLESPTSSSD
jgi:hypothetical protein